MDRRHDPPALESQDSEGNGVFVVAPAEQAKLGLLYERYGVTDEDAEALALEPKALSGQMQVERSQNGDLKDVGDVVSLPVIR